MLNADLINGFSGSVLAKNFDEPVATPSFHREMWELCCSPKKKVAICAPRGHAKSTAITHSYVLANIAFRQKKFIVIIANTENQAINFLNDIKLEVKENEFLHDEKDGFGIDPKLFKDRETEFIGTYKDTGEHFRVIVKSTGQEVRGLKWRGARPDLIVGDDLEDTETVLNQDRREKFRNWFFADVLPALSKTGTIRIVGTILHMDALLERLMGDGEWLTKKFRAHNLDFSEILWPERFSKDDLLGIRQSFINQGIPEKYAQEYLNEPIDDSSAYFKANDFRSMDTSHHSLPKNYYMSVDFAISQKERADFTVIAVVGADEDGNLHCVDIRRGRWDAKMIIDEIFSAYQRYLPETVILENGVINQAIGPFLYDEMRARNIYMPLTPISPTKDKVSRARSLQARMRSGGMYFDKEADWYVGLELEMRRFPFDVHDDQTDALALVGLYLQNLIHSQTAEEIAEEEYEEEMTMTLDFSGRSATTGY